MKRWIVGSVAALMITSWMPAAAWAQNAKERDQDGPARKKSGRDAKREKSQDRGDQQRRPKSAKAQLQSIAQAMQKELNLSQEQTDEIKVLFQKELERMGAEGSTGTDSGNEELMAQLKEEAREARQSNDKERLREINQQLKEMRGDSAKGASTLDKDFLDSVAKVLDEKQQKGYWDIVSRYNSDGRNNADVMEQLKNVLSGIDLSAEQKSDIDDMIERYEKDASKEDQDPKSAKAALAKLLKDINSRLEPEQKKAFSQKLKEDRGAKRDSRDGKGREPRSRKAKGNRAERNRDRE